MEAISRPFLSSIQGKLDEELRKQIEAAWMVPLKAALRQLNMSLEEQEKFTLDMQKYARTINPTKLRTIPNEQLLPFLLTSLWSVHVRTGKSEDLEERTRLENATDTDASYETVEEEDADEPQEASNFDPEDPCAEGAETRIHRKNLVDIQGQDGSDSTSKKLKLLLDNVAPFYVDRHFLEPQSSLAQGQSQGQSQSRPSSVNAQAQAQRGAKTTAVTENQTKSQSQSHSHSQALSLDSFGIKRIGQIARLDIETAELTDSERLRASRAIWRQTINHMEPEYRLPTLILKKHQYVKREEPRNLGPGCYEPYICPCARGKKFKKGQGVQRGQMYSCNPRFSKDMVKSDCPDPGAYGNPFMSWKKFCDQCRHPGKVTLLQSGPCNLRGKTFKTVGSALGPGDYEIRSSIQQLLNKKCGKRGPYDLFSQNNRFDTLHGYFRESSSQLEPGMYGIYGTMKDMLMSRDQINKGKLSKLARDQKVSGERITISNPMWPTADQESEPGPGDHEIHEPNYRSVCWGENYWAFNISSQNVRPLSPTDYDNAPTRYRPELYYHKLTPIGGGYQSNFEPNASKPLHPKKVALLTERLRGKDIPPNEKHTETWSPSLC